MGTSFAIGLCSPVGPRPGGRTRGYRSSIWRVRAFRHGFRGSWSSTAQVNQNRYSATPHPIDRIRESGAESSCSKPTDRDRLGEGLRTAHPIPVDLPRADRPLMSVGCRSWNRSFPCPPRVFSGDKLASCTPIERGAAAHDRSVKQHPYSKLHSLKLSGDLQ